MSSVAQLQSIYTENVKNILSYTEYHQETTRGHLQFEIQVLSSILQFLMTADGQIKDSNKDPAPKVTPADLKWHCMEFPAVTTLLLPKTQLCTPNTAPSSAQSCIPLLEGLHINFFGLAINESS